MGPMQSVLQGGWMAGVGNKACGGDQRQWTDRETSGRKMRGAAFVQGKRRQ
jgi:hypothetical protein